MLTLPTHHFKLALLHPQIAPNTGNIARLCVATGTTLHIIRPMGFTLDEKSLRRSAMDYWPRLRLTLYDDDAAFFAHVGNEPIWLFDSSGERDLWDCDFRNGDWLIFGSETNGIAADVLGAHRDRVVRIPQANGERCLNLSTAAGIAMYEALRHVRA